MKESEVFEEMNVPKPINFRERECPILRISKEQLSEKESKISLVMKDSHGEEKVQPISVETDKHCTRLDEYLSCVALAFGDYHGRNK